MGISEKFFESSISVSNSQHSMLDFHKENTALLKNKCQEIISENMLTSLADINSLVSVIYIYDISNMICQLHHLHLEQYFIQQKYNIN